MPPPFILQGAREGRSSTLGRDVLSLYERMTFNFESMSFILE